MVLFNHIKPDVSCLDHSQCLLTSNASFLKAISNQEAKLEGCYLYYDSNNGEWIRSGKAVGSNFGLRHGQHKNESRLTTASSQKSKFYNSYPSKAVSLPDQSSKKGVFESLQMFVGMGYYKLVKGKVTDDFARGGIFHFDSETNTKIADVNFHGSTRLQTKQLHMLGYLWELAYDLCIAPNSNISGNPGFETLLGVY